MNRQNKTLVSGTAVDAWISQFPEQSINRLGHINRSTNSARHVLLALAYGTFDKSISELNRVITALLVARMRAERAGLNAKVQRINAYMVKLHEAIDFATGVEGRVEVNPNPCNRPIPGKKVG